VVLQWTEKRKRGTPPKRCRDKYEEDLNIMGIKNSQVMNRDRGEWSKTVLEVNVRKGIERLSTSVSSSGGGVGSSSSSSSSGGGGGSSSSSGGSGGRSRVVVVVVVVGQW
jgi:uncharacterized membrane protein YgcG